MELTQEAQDRIAHRLMLTVALQELKRIKRDDEAMRLSYAADVESWRKENYRPEYCIHGTYMWTDYDNICGGCEAGDEPLDVYYRALWAAKRRIKAWRAAGSIYSAAATAHAPKHVLDAITEWITDDLSNMDKEVQA